MNRTRGGRLRLDVAVNIGCSVLRVLAMMLVVRLAGQAFPAAGLGLFLLSRRVGSTWANLFQAGSSQTLMRFVAMHADDPAVKRRYVATAALYWLGLTAVFVPACHFLRQPLSDWLLPEAADAGATAFWTGMFLLGTIANFIVYSTLLAERRIALANLFEFTNASGFLLALFLLPEAGFSPLDTLRLQSLGMIGLSLACLALYLALVRPKAPAAGSAGPTVARDFAAYGLPRALVPFLEMGLTLLGPWLIRDHLAESGYLIMALTFVRVVEMFVQPVVLVSSVVAARLLGVGDRRSLADGGRLLFGAVLTAAAVALAVVAPFRSQLLVLWLGDPALAVQVDAYVSVLFWSMIPYTVYQGLKGIIEVKWVRPVNLMTLAAGLAVQAGVFYACRLAGLDPFAAVGVSLAVSFTVLGVCSTLWMRRTLSPFRWYGPWRLGLVCAGLFAVNACLSPLVARPIMALPVMAATGSLAALALAAFPSPFLREMWAFVRPVRPSREP